MSCLRAGFSRPGVSVDALSFEEYKEFGRKQAVLTARDTFALMLRQARLCGEAGQLIGADGGGGGGGWGWGVAVGEWCHGVLSPEPPRPLPLPVSLVAHVGQIRGCSAGKALMVVDKYPTPARSGIGACCRPWCVCAVGV